jgi:hypothetical protein
MTRQPWEPIGPQNYEKELERRCPNAFKLPIITEHNNVSTTKPSKCSVCESESCEGTHELAASKHQWVLTSEYCNLKIHKADAEIIILKAFAEFGTTDHQMSGEFRPWLSVEAQKRLYWILKNFIDKATKDNEDR